MAETTIEWAERVWNPVVGCTAVSPGCANCYAVPITHRVAAMGQAKYRNLTVVGSNGRRRFSGEVRTIPEALEIPLRRRKPTRWLRISPAPTSAFRTCGAVRLL